MSLNSIIGNTSTDTDAKKVRWANIVCNSIYSLEGYNGGEINVDYINAISIDTIDLKATDIIVTNINGKPPASVKNSSDVGSSLVAEPSPSDYEIRRLRAGTGINLNDNPGYVEIARNSNRVLQIDDFINSPGQQIAFLSASSSSTSLMTFFAVPLALCSTTISGLVTASNALITYNMKAMDPLIPGIYGILYMIYRGSLTGITASKWSTFSLGAMSPTSTNNFQRNLFNFLLSSSTNISRVYKLYFEPTLELAADGTTVLNTFNNFSDDFYFSFGISNLTTIQRDLSLTSGNPYKNDLASSVQCFLYKLAGVSYASITILDNLVVVSTENIPISSLLINTVYYLKIEVVSSNIIISFIDNAAAIIFTRSYNISLLNNTLSYGFYNNYTMYNVSDTTFNVAQFSYDYISTETERALVL
jgi:hypothetical protein